MVTQITAPGLDRLGEMLRRAPQIARDEIVTALEEAGAYLTGEIADRTPNHQGELARSFIADRPLVGPLGVSSKIGSPLDYAPAVEFGARPHMPPVEPLKDWAQSKLGLSPLEADRAAWRIAWKIKHHGTEGAHMVQDALAAGQKTLAQIFNAAADRIVERMQNG